VFCARDVCRGASCGTSSCWGKVGSLPCGSRRAVLCCALRSPRPLSTSSTVHIIEAVPQNQNVWIVGGSEGLREHLYCFVHHLVDPNTLTCSHSRLEWTLRAALHYIAKAIPNPVWLCLPTSTTWTRAVGMVRNSRHGEAPEQTVELTMLPPAFTPTTGPFQHWAIAL
jgi:hypothetical protein